MMTDHDATRRSFLGCLTSLVLVLLGLLLVVPAIWYLCSPLRRRNGSGGSEAGFLDAGPLEDLPAGEWRLLPLETTLDDGWRRSRATHAVWVRREAHGEPGVAVLSTLCPHLGCPINWRPEQGQFHCPCHGGLFDDAGRRTAGPPPRGMDPLEFEVRDGRLWVRWQEFKIGVAERVPVSV
jgi:nitrite reductase/ring-hydroxylating ferredoxin subunit